MSIFGTILSKIFDHGGAKPPAAPSAGDTTAPAAATPPAANPPPPAPVTTADATAAPAPASQDTSSPAAVAQAPAATVDVAAVLDGLAAKNSQKLDWKRSIVDMMKLLDMDSSLSARKTLAEELHYGGDTDDSASMNIWLHKQVMQKLAENGGKVPDDLKG